MDDREIEGHLRDALPRMQSAGSDERILSIPVASRRRAVVARVVAAVVILVLIGFAWSWLMRDESDALRHGAEVVALAGGGRLEVGRDAKVVATLGASRIRIVTGDVVLEAVERRLAIDFVAGAFELEKGRASFDAHVLTQVEAETKMKKLGWSALAGGMLFIVVRLSADGSGDFEIEKSRIPATPGQETAIALEQTASGRWNVVERSGGSVAESITASRPVADEVSSDEVKATIPADAHFRGRVVDDKTGEPLRDARAVMVLWNSGYNFFSIDPWKNFELDDLPKDSLLPAMTSQNITPLEETKVDADGRFFLSKRPTSPLRVLGILVTSSERGPMFRRYEPQSVVGDLVEFRLRPVRRVSVRVTDEVGRPIRNGANGTRLSLSVLWLEHLKVHSSFTCGLEGPEPMVFDFGALDEVSIHAQAEGYSNSEIDVTLSEGASVEAWIKLMSVQSFEGKVRRRDGTPIANAMVGGEFKGRDDNGSEYRLHRAVFTDEDGYFRITDWGSVTEFVCRATGFNPVVVKNPVSTSGPIDFVLDPETRIHWTIRVLDAHDRPRVGLAIHVEQAMNSMLSGITNASGEAVFEEVLPGTYKVHLPTGIHEVVLEANAERRVVTTLRLPATGRIEGTVGAELMADAQFILLVRPAATLFGNHETLEMQALGSDGRFSFDDAPVGRLAVVLKGKRRQVKLVEVKADQTVKVEFGSTGLTVRGRLVDGEVPVAGAEVIFAAITDDAPRTSDGRSDDDGRFEVSGVDPAATLIRVDSKGRIAFFLFDSSNREALQLAWPTASLEVAFERDVPGATLFLVAMGPTSLDGIPKSLRRVATVEMGGDRRIRFEGLSPGRYEVEIIVDGTPTARSFDVGPGVNVATW